MIGFKHIYRTIAENEMSCLQISLSFWAMEFFKHVKKPKNDHENIYFHESENYPYFFML